MDLSKIADYLTVAFLLWYGLQKFMPRLDEGALRIAGGILAILAAVFVFLST
jgi:hypothetical protein